MASRLSVFVLLSSALAATPARADDPAYTFGKKDDVKDVKAPTWTAKGELGLVSTTGNSKQTTVSAGGNIIRKDPDNKLEANLVGTYARAEAKLVSDDNGNGVIDENELTRQTSTSAESGQVKLRYDRYLTESNSLFATALAGVDVPAGKDFIGEGQVGYSRSIFKDSEVVKDKDGKDKEEIHHEVLGEVGYDISYLSLSSAGSTTIHSARVFAGYKGKLTKDTALEASLEALFNLNTVTIGAREATAFKDTRLNGVVSFTTAVSTKVSLAASFQVKFDNFPSPLGKIGDLDFAPGFVPLADKTDTLTKLSLIFKFL